jgi:protease-4
VKRVLKLGLFLYIAVALSVVVVFFYYLFWPSSGGAPKIEPGTTLVLEIGGRYVEAERSPIYGRLFGDARRPFVSLLSSISKAERDERIDMLVLVIRPLDIGWGKAEELRDALHRFEASGGRTLAYLDMASFGGSREYYIATAAEEIYLVPGGAVPVIGLAAEYLYLGGLFAKLGVVFEVGQAGKYKSAVEGYAGTGMSEPSREMANSLLDATHHLFVSGIAEGRGLSHDDALGVIDKGPMLPAELEQLGLIDGSLHLDELIDEMANDVVYGRDYADVDPHDLGFDPVADVALIYGSGNVVEGRDPLGGSGEPVFAAATISEAILDASRDESIAAIILRIDSPGGSALASEQVWRAVQKARDEGKPIIASFSDYAASGAYYVAVAADAIVSPRGALTGSIGVFALRPVLGGAMDKLGVGSETMTRGRYADFLLSGPPLSEVGRARLDHMVLETYRIFLERVAAGRSLSVEEVDVVAQGRVWTGGQAAQRGLVDEIGGLHTAVSRVRDRLGLAADADVALVVYPAARTLTEELADLFSGGFASALAAHVQEEITARLTTSGLVPGGLRRVESMLLGLPRDGPLLLPPVLIDIR